MQRSHSVAAAAREYAGDFARVASVTERLALAGGGGLKNVTRLRCC